MYGAVGVVNSALPSLLWFFWKEQGGALTIDSLLYWGWQAAWIVHTTCWSIIALLFGFTSFRLAWVDQMFMFWANMISAAPFSLYFAVETVLFLATLFWEEPNKAGEVEHWITLGVYTVFAGATSFI